MSTTTQNLGLFKYDLSTDGEELFKIDRCLNNNWDIIDNFAASGKGASRCLGEIVTSTLPLSEADLYELNGDELTTSGDWGDFVSEILKRYQINPTLDIFAQPYTSLQCNYIGVGRLVEVQGILSDFKQKNSYATLPILENPNNAEGFELVLKAYFPSIIANSELLNTPADKHGIILRVTDTSGNLKVWIGNGSGAWALSSITTGVTVKAGVWNYIKVTWDGSDYNFYTSTDGIDWTSGKTQTGKTSATDLKTGIQLGAGTREAYQLNGSIDLSGCYLKYGTRYIWQGAIEVHHSAEEAYFNAITLTGSCRKYLCYPDEDKIRIPLVPTNNRFLTEKWNDGADWYRIYSDGWCEQGGRIYNNTAADNYIKLKKPYKDTNYTVLINHGVSGVYTSTLQGQYCDEPSSFLPDSFMVRTYNSAGLNNVQWYSYGYIKDIPSSNAPLYEYLVVGTDIKLPAYIEIDQVISDLNNKINKSDLIEVQSVIETYTNGTSWYRIWSDGWLEQGGRFVVASGSQSGGAYSYATLQFLKPFAALMNWQVQAKHDCFSSGFDAASYSAEYQTVICYQKNLTSSSYINPFVVWYASGYLAEG